MIPADVIIVPHIRASRSHKAHASQPVQQSAPARKMSDNDAWFILGLCVVFALGFIVITLLGRTTR